MAVRFHVDLHRPELEKQKTRTSVANTFLPEEDRSGRNNFDPERQQDDQRQPEGHAQQDAGDIKNSLPKRYFLGSGICGLRRTLSHIFAHLRLMMVGLPSVANKCSRCAWGSLRGRNRRNSWVRGNNVLDWNNLARVRINCTHISLD